MKYFLDFEASQYDERIISFGCVDENGRSFYSLVRPKHERTITPFVTKLTGLTYSMLTNAPTPDEIFTSFGDWLGENAENAEFYVYGNRDKPFVVHTKSELTSASALHICNLLTNKIIDFNEHCIEKKFNENLALITVLAYYRQAPITSQRHNALEDALWLREVYFYIEKDPNEYTKTFSDELRIKYPKIKIKPDKKEKDSAKVDGIIVARKMTRKGNVYPSGRSYNSFEDVAEAIIAYRRNHDYIRLSKKEVIRHIRDAIANNQAFSDHMFKIERRKN